MHDVHNYVSDCAVAVAVPLSDTDTTVDTPDNSDSVAQSVSNTDTVTDTDSRYATDTGHDDCCLLPREIHS